MGGDAPQRQGLVKCVAPARGCGGRLRPRLCRAAAAAPALRVGAASTCHVMESPALRGHADAPALLTHGGVPRGPCDLHGALAHGPSTYPVSRRGCKDARV